VQPQDVIVEFSGAKINSPRNLQAIASRSAIGSTLPVVVFRDGKKHELHVTLQEAPANYGERTVKPTEAPAEAEDAAKFNKFGLQVVRLTGDVAQQLGITGASGVVITAVEDGSPADKAGLAASEVITQVSRKPVKTVAEFEAEVKNASPEKGLL